MSGCDWLAPRPTETKTYPIRLFGSRQSIPMPRTSALFELQRAVADVKFALVSKMIQEDMVAVSDMDVRIIIEARQRTVPVEATQGESVRLPDDWSHFTVFSSTWPMWSGR